MIMLIKLLLTVLIALRAVSRVAYDLVTAITGKVASDRYAPPYGAGLPVFILAISVVAYVHWIFIIPIGVACTLEALASVRVRHTLDD